MFTSKAVFIQYTNLFKSFTDITGLTKENAISCFNSSNTMKKRSDKFYVSYAILNCKDAKLLSPQSWAC